MCLEERGPSVPFESNHPVSDGKADYLWINPPNGIVRAWTDNYPDSPAWLDSGEYAGSVAMPGTNIRFAKLQPRPRKPRGGWSYTLALYCER